MRPFLWLFTLLSASLASCSIAWDDPSRKPAYLRDYINAHYKDLGERFQAPLSRPEFLAQLTDTEILFIGDQHLDFRLHERILALIDDLCEAGFRPVLGMEAIGREDNPNLQEFVAGGIGLTTLRERIAARTPDSWLDRLDVDHIFFRRLLARVREHDLAAFPLESIPRLPLAERDAEIVQSIRRAIRLHPKRLVVVIVGHAHICGTGHLRYQMREKSMVIGARLNHSLAAQRSESQDSLPESSFRQSDRGILFFPEVLSPTSH